ncbi:MAG TPA: hypothetical protein VJN71_09055 [Nitrososphaerales archaeon]|nr:hypothetical protein [Nitrososphaerales archaeon]
MEDILPPSIASVDWVYVRVAVFAGLAVVMALLVTPAVYCEGATIPLGIVKFGGIPESGLIFRGSSYDYCRRRVSSDLCCRDLLALSFFSIQYSQTALSFGD